MRDLQPNHAYQLQRQVDLSEGLAPPPTQVTTDERGTGRAALFRDLNPPGPPTGPPPGMRFDIHFRVVDAASPVEPVLASGCYVFTLSL